MAKAEINPGICGLKSTVVTTKNEDGTIHVSVESECAAVRKLAERVSDVDPYREISWHKRSPEVHEHAPQCLSHTSCPVPSGILKAIEVEAGLALPADVIIRLSKGKD
jgi:hypothetical protein